MMGSPSKCPSCGEVNSSGLDYCAICGIRFTRARQGSGPSRRKVSKEAKLKLKREKKRGELTELFKRKKITLEQYRKGLNKLGYTTDIDKAEEFKKFIRSQIKDLKNMKVPPPGGPTERYDPYASKAELMRDRSGDVMTDFMVKPTPVNRREMGAVMDAPSGGGPGHGPLFADSLFARKPEGRMSAPGGYATRPVADKPRIGEIVRMPGLDKSPPTRPPDRISQRGKLKMVWDDESEDPSDLRRGVYSGDDESVDIEEEEFVIDLDYDETEVSSDLLGIDLEEEEDDFEIDLDEYSELDEEKKEVKVWWEDEEDDWWDEEGEGESGWWDDEDWELEEDDEDGKVEKRKAVKVSWEEEDDEDEFVIDLEEVDEEEFVIEA